MIFYCPVALWRPTNTPTHQVIISIVVQSCLVFFLSLYHRWYLKRPQVNRRITERILLMCSDVQGILGFSILFASLTQIKEISLYHAAIVWHLAFLIFVSQLSAFHCLIQLDQPLRALIPRLFIVSTSLVLFTAFGTIIWLRVWDERCSPLIFSGIHLFLSTFAPIVYFSLYAAVKFDPCTCWPTDFVSRCPRLRRLWPLLTGVIHVGAFIFAVYAVCSLYAPTSGSFVLAAEGGDRVQERQWGFGQVIAIIAVAAIVLEAYKIRLGRFVQ
jgi:hypothetical protein